jgi:hypothetical protein
LNPQSGAALRQYQRSEIMASHRKHATKPPSDLTGPAPATQTVVGSGDKGRNAQFAPAEAVRLCAYRKWEIAGKPTGDGIQFWLEAEQELMHGK